MTNTKEKDDLVGYQTWNKSVTLYASAVYPADPALYETFLHIVGNSWWIESWDGSQWVRICQLEPSEILSKLLTVDGPGTGLDADLLDGQHGSYYRSASNLNAGTIPLARIPSTLTGKNADLLDGQHGSYYQNASNLNAGTILRVRLGALWRDTDSNQTDSPYIQSGKATIASGTGTQTINFDYAYSETPRITIGSSNVSSITVLVSESTSGFIINKYMGISYGLNWIAIGRKA